MSATVSLRPVQVSGELTASSDSAVLAELSWQMEVLLSWRPVGRHLVLMQSRRVKTKRLGTCFHICNPDRKLPTLLAGLGLG
jgi:hypothetical protein